MNGCREMDFRIIIVMILTFIITLIGTVAYSIRIVGVRTGKIAVSFALFNIFTLISRTANTIQGSMLTKYVENSQGYNILHSFYMIIFSAGMATIAGAILIPSFQRMFTKGVNRFSIERSIPKIMLHGFSKAGIKQFKTCLTLPSTDIIKKIELENFQKEYYFLMH